MKTFLVRNRFGREVQVPESVALTFKGNPSMTIIGELKTTAEAKEIMVPVKNKSARKMVRQVAKIVEVVKNAVPGIGNTDVEYKGNLIKQKTIVTKSGNEIRKSSKLKD